MAPGPDLALALARVDRQQLGGHDRVELLRARARQVAHDQAQLYADIQSVSEAVGEMYHIDDLEERFHTACSEVRVALTLTRRSAEAQVDMAFKLRERLPRVWSALHQGIVDLPKARVICDQTIHLPREEARRVADAALLSAPDLTTGQLRARIQRLVIAIDPVSARDRYERRLEERGVVLDAGEDGTANLYGFHLPAADANAAMRRINRLARAAKTKGDPRTIDQIRADVLLDLLASRSQNGSGSDRGVVDIRVDLDTLAGLDENPGLIPGWGPVIADIARKITREQDESEWRITITDEDGRPIGVTTTKRRPTAIQRQQVEARNPTCVFPGCPIPAGQSDLDHEHHWSETHLTPSIGLEPLCRHDHVNRHQRHWTLRQVEPGVHEWVSPLGHKYLPSQRASLTDRPHFPNLPVHENRRASRHPASDNVTRDGGAAITKGDGRAVTRGLTRRLRTMSSFAARLRMPGRSKLPMGVEVDIFRERMTVMAGDQKVGDWALDELDIESKSDGFHVTVDGEEIILHVTDSTRFATELGITGRPPVRLVEISASNLPRSGLASIKGQLNYQRALNGEPASSLLPAETSSDGGQVEEIRRRISEVAEALASDSVSPAQAFARWLGLLKEVNYRHGQGSMTTDRFFELNTELLDLIPGPAPDLI